MSTSTRSVANSVKRTFNAVADTAVASCEFVSGVVRVSSQTTLHNLHTDKVDTFRNNAVENLANAKGAFNTVLLSARETQASITQADEFTVDRLRRFLEVEHELLDEISASAKLPSL